ncbi:MAG TPA: iron ABC transporter permease [Symbiobacteriaceae bacterium]|nr:iron ABC transporter permease [Symbiobacteriaceae bacterium]
MWKRYVGLGLALGVALLLSVMVGAVQVPATAVFDALRGHGPEQTVLIVNQIRLPRAVVGALVGAGLAVAGAVMQAATRNPLAAPSVAGVTAGATLVVTLLMVAGIITGPVVAFGAFVGAALGGGVVFALASGKGATPTRLALAGIAVSALLSAVGTGIVMTREANLTLMIAWQAGGLGGKIWSHAAFLWPWVLVGLVAAWLLSPYLDVMRLGDEVSVGLGVNLGYARAGALLVTVILAGGAVAVAGPIGFVGLIIPHIARSFFPHRHRLLLPACALGGALLLTLADTLGRFVGGDIEIPVGILTALLGGPFFVYLVRREGK